MKPFCIRLMLACAVLACATVTFAMTPSPNDGFNPNVDGSVRALAVQPDGKILAGGDFHLVGGVARSRLARINIDGTLDPTFSDAHITSRVLTIAVQADGKILVGGTYTSVMGKTRNRIVRLNSNGSVDAGFTTGANGSVNAFAIQGDGKILIGGAFTTIGGIARNRIARLNPDGSVDMSFDPGAGPDGPVNAIIYLAGGKVLIGGSFHKIAGLLRHAIARLNADGTLDSKYIPSGMESTSSIAAMAPQADGMVVVGGSFVVYQGGAISGLARVKQDGKIDSDFRPYASAIGTACVNVVAIQPDGKVLAGGTFTTMNATAQGHVARLNTNGSLDTTFGAGTGASADINAVAMQLDGKPLLGGDFTKLNGAVRNRLARVYADGSVDTSFSCDSASLTCIQPDGKIILSDYFGLHRVQIDGSTDASFTSNHDGGHFFGLQLDGKILSNTAPTYTNGVWTTYLKRLTSTGNPDPTFQTVTFSDMIMSPGPGADGKILVGGYFHLNGGAECSLMRLNGDGSVDGSFFSGISGIIRDIVVQPDGRILIAGGIVACSPHRHLIRLNSNGSLDGSFNDGIGTNENGAVGFIALQIDGKIVVGGDFTNFNGKACPGIVRLNADGSLDNGFNPSGFPGNQKLTIYSIHVQSDGKVLANGFYQDFGGTWHEFFLRMSPDGALDPQFGIVYPSDVGNKMNLQSDGKLLFNSHRFTNPDPAIESLSVARGGDCVTWNLGGSYPMPSQVLFEESADGIRWAQLGCGTPVAGTGFRIENIRLPENASRYVRATGFVHSSRFQSVRRYYVPGNNAGAWLRYE